MNTKLMLAQALKLCMKKAPLEKITVKDITDTCGVSRQTFYRYFKDRTDLVNWYFEIILKESFQYMGKGNTIYESLINKFTYIQNEKLFFTEAFKNDEQNNLKEYDFKSILDFYVSRIHEKMGQDIPEDLLFQLEMYCQGSVYMTVRWLLTGAKESPAIMAKRLTDAMPSKVEEVFLRIHLR